MIYCLNDVEMVFFFFFDGLLKQLSFAKMKAASMERPGLCPKFKNFELVELLGPLSHPCERF
jgi:hypothetical protein